MPLKDQVGPEIPASVRGGLKMGDEQYLWLLVLLETGFLFWGRYVFRRFHGG